ncbi:hypothetical protein L0657_15650 [Dyadobacter sp. CY345]|uniref:SMODS-associated NUDIX domain-containing protein n=1 Tax=Dyadobacter sp. CY345 TaxID=2909335 RepID=UPI001F334370|nr:hypothetical protein [Dyadobacter sp. CY345]MCF2445397.1 hypothetical protein [Dyadobacter sp. CY345]
MIAFKQNVDLQGSIRDVGFGLLSSILILLISNAYESRAFIKIWFQSWLKPSKPVRISMAYFFRIRVNGKYLLIDSHRRPGSGYQPVGGVYKYLPNETSTLFNSLGIEDINGIPIDVDSKNDLRCIVKKRKHLPKFIRWFNSKKDRETDPWREFYEELVASGILPHNKFPYLQYVHCGCNYEGIKDPDFFTYDEFLYADIFELKPDGPEQLGALIALDPPQSDQIIFATHDEIQNGRTVTGKVILPQTKKILT